MAVEDNDCAGGDEGLHGGGVSGIGAQGEEAMPVGLVLGAPGAIFVEPRRGDGDALDDGMGGDDGVVHGDGGGDERDRLDLALVRWDGCGLKVDCAGRQDLGDGEVLGGEDAVETVEGEGPFAIEEVRDMCLAEAGLLGEARAGEGVGVDAPEEFNPEVLVEVGEVHSV